MKTGRNSLAMLLTVAISSFLLGWVTPDSREMPSITANMVEQATALIGLSFNEAEKDSMLEGLTELRGHYEKVRSVTLDNSVPPAVRFNPIPVGAEFDRTRKPFKTGPVNLPELTKGYRRSCLCFGGTIGGSDEIPPHHLGAAHPDVSATPEAIQPAAGMRDYTYRRIGAGSSPAGRCGDCRRKVRGPLHGIPYGAKDLLAVKGYPTTWGRCPTKIR